MSNKWSLWLQDKIGDLRKPNETIQTIERSITGKVYEKMKTAIAISETVTFATMMRTKIRLPDNTLVPVNGISFIIAESGASKDRSLNQARKCFSDIYSKMHTYLEKQAIKTARKESVDNGKTEDEWGDFYVPPRPLFGGAKPTISGVIAHLNAMQEQPVGGGHIYSGEFGAELANGSTMMELLQFAAEIYDLGNIKADWRKTVEAQGKEIKSMNFSSVFITSPGHIIYDQTIKKKFVMEFTTKLARRSFFNFNQNGIENPDETIEELLERERRELNDSIEAVDAMKLKLQDVKPELFNVITLEDGLWDIYGITKRMYEEISESVDPELESYRLSLAHTQWRALKLAGALCQVDNRRVITKEDFAQALYYMDLFEEDIKEFNIELNKESYELLDDFVNSIYQDHPIELTAHKLSKLGYITSVSGVKTKLKDLVDMANDITEGIYSADGTKIIFEKLQTKEFIGASYMRCEGTKEQRAKKCSVGFDYKETGFDRIANLLSNDTVYCPFEFKNGERSNTNIIGGTKWVCLDIDHSDITDEEAHDMLGDFNHHIARTSNESDPFKFRIALELDKYVKIDNKKWKKFIESISRYIGVDADLLPPGQIYFGYKGRRVLSTLVADPLPVKEHILYANKEDEKRSTPSAKECKELLDNPMNTFGYAYDAETGGRSLALIRAARHAKDLFANKDQIITLMHDINNYWVEPLEEDRFNRTIVSQIERWFE